MLSTSTKSPGRRRTGRPASTTQSLVTFEEPINDEEITQPPVDFLPEPGTYFEGKRVLREEPVSNLPNRAFRFVRVVLEGDAPDVFRCLECPAEHPTYKETRGKMLAHRIRFHGRKKQLTEEQLVEIELPEDVRDLTFGDMLAIAPTMAALGNYFDEKTDENERLFRENMELRRRLRDIEPKVMGAEATAAELKEARAQLRKVKTQLSNMRAVFQEVDE